MVVSKILFQSLAHSISAKSMKQHWYLIIHRSLITTFLNRHFGIIMKRCLPILISDTEIINPGLSTWKILFYWYFHPQYLCFLLLLLPVPFTSYMNVTIEYGCHNSFLPSKQQVHHLRNTHWIKLSRPQDPRSISEYHRT